MSERVFTQTFGVVAAVIEKDGKFLMVRVAKEKSKNQWDHPAGWIEVGENLIDAVKREVKEETSFDFEPKNILGVYSFIKEIERFNFRGHAIKIVFTGEISNPSGVLADDISETKWFTAEEIKNMDANTLRDKDIKLMIDDYLAGKKYPLEIISHSSEIKL